MADAQSIADEETRAIAHADGAEAARSWRCPRTGCAPDPAALDADHAEALDAVDALTGTRFKTCPLSRGWEQWLHTVVRADEHGIAEYRAAYGAPPRTLVQSVDLLRIAKRKRDAEEARVAKSREANK